MSKKVYIQNIKTNVEINDVFLIANSSKHISQKGDPFWNIELCDNSGQIQAKIWSPLAQKFQEFSTGSLAMITGQSAEFNKKTQITIKDINILNDDDVKKYNMADFIISSPYNIEDMWQELMHLCKHELSYQPWRNFVNAVFKSEEIINAWKESPAAKSIHHAYRGGLLEHSLGVTKLSLSMVKHYPNLDKEVLLVGAMFHDIGKIWEFKQGIVSEYADQGLLIGHMQLGLEKLEPFLVKSKLEPELITHFKHLILSHHGSYEFGSPRLPQTPEAILLHYADNIDAKMAQCRSLFANWDAEVIGWSDYQRSLERSIYNPMRTPQNTKQKVTEDHNMAIQTSLL